MADANARKRKRPAEGKTQPKKKAAVESEAPTKPIRVSSVTKAKYCPPVVVSATGIRLESDLAFQPFTKREKSTTKKSKRLAPSDQDLALHSTTHRTLDYTVREEEEKGEPSNGAPTQRHYIGVYDPRTGGLEVIEAKKMVARGTVRAKQADEEAMVAPADSKTYRDQKVELGQTFGTKKARKAIESVALNAIAPVESELNEDGTRKKLDAASKATLSQIGEITSKMATREDLQAVVDQSKPVPRANLEATEIADVYDPSVFIGAEVLKAVPVRDWQDKIEANEEVEVMSRFVARRIVRIARQERPVEKLRLLRYMYFLLVFLLTAKAGKRDTRRVPPKDQLAKNLSPAPSSVIENIRRKFSEAGEIRKFHLDLLITHCCVISAIVDNYETLIKDLGDDLHLDRKTTAQYFSEIGAKMGQAKLAGEAKAQPVAKLALPLQFPKLSRGAPKRR